VLKFIFTEISFYTGAKSRRSQCYSVLGAERNFKREPCWYLIYVKRKKEKNFFYIYTEFSKESPAGT